MIRPDSRCILLLAALSLASCATNGNNDVKVPTEPLHATPGLAPEFLFSSVEPPSDKNHDDWPDMFHVVMLLFRTDSRQPKAFDGTFEIRIFDLNETLIQRWIIGPDNAPGALGVRGGLTGYSFRLEMPLPEPDAWFPDRVQVETKFIPQNGQPQISRTVLIAFRIR